MSVPKEPLPALLFLSILAAEWERFWPGLKQDLESRFGPLAYCSEPFAFRQTGYYDRELGAPILRRVLGFDRLIPLGCLAQTKLDSNAMETAGARPDGRRRFNLDPGLLGLERLVLATGKNYSHRIYLGQGIFAELTLQFQKGQWRSLPWTFPDYAGREMQAHLTLLRELCREKLTRLREDASAAGINNFPDRTCAE